MSICDLPSEVWARVCTFLPEDDRIPCFYALRYAGVLSVDVHEFHTMSVFLSEMAQEERAAAVREADALQWPSLDAVVTQGLVTVLQEMGFGHDAATAALVANGDDRELAINDLTRASVQWWAVH